jgi:hypothetical protein
MEAATEPFPAFYWLEGRRRASEYRFRRFSKRVHGQTEHPVKTK